MVVINRRTTGTSYLHQRPSNGAPTVFSGELACLLMAMLSLGMQTRTRSRLQEFRCWNAARPFVEQNGAMGAAFS